MMTMPVHNRTIRKASPTAVPTVMARVTFLLPLWGGWRIVVVSADKVEKRPGELVVGLE